MSFCWCTVHVKNMDASVQFYEDIVGIYVDRRFKSPTGAEIAFLGDGETKLELVANQGIFSGSGISVGMMVDDVDQKIAFLKEKGIPVHSGPFTPNPSIKYFYVQDPDGLLVQFVQRT